MATRTTGPGSGGTGFVASTAWTEAAIDKLPGGLAAYATDTGASAQTATADYGSVTFTTLDDRKYMVEASSAIGVDTGAAQFRVMIVNGSNTELEGRYIEFDSATGNMPFHIRYLATGDGTSKTFKVRVSRASGTGRYSIGDVLLTVTDLGPSF